MKTRLLLLTVLGLTTAEVSAQAPAPRPRVAPPTSERAAVPPAAPPAAAEAAPEPAPPPPYPTAWVPPPPQPVYRMPPPRLRPVPSPRRYGDAGAPIAVGVGASVLFRKDEAYHLFTDAERGSALELLASYDVWTPFRGAIVAAGVSVRREALEEVGDLDLDLAHSTVQADLVARYGVRSILWPHVRVAVGVVSSRARARDRVSEVDFEDRDSHVASTFGAGVTLRTPSRLFETHGGRLASLSVGLLLEGGYTLAKDATLDAKPTSTGDVPRPAFALGSVERSGAYLRMMAVVRF